LASHKSVTTFPETQFFSAVTRGRLPYKQVLAYLGIATGKEVDCLKKVLKRFGREDLIPLLPEQPWQFKECVAIYLSVLDHITVEEGNKLWVEKTPLHILRLDLIEEYVPSPLVVHIVRNGCDVVASIVDRYRKNSEMFKEQDIDYGIDLWNKCIVETEKWIDKENHYVVEYEDIVRDPLNALNRIGGEINLKFEKSDIMNRDDAVERAVLDSEPWKSNVYGKIKERSKYESIFDNDTIYYINNNLEIDIYNNITNPQKE